MSFRLLTGWMPFQTGADEILLHVRLRLSLLPCRDMAAIIERLQAAVQACQADQSQEALCSQDEAAAAPQGEGEEAAEAAAEAVAAEHDVAAENSAAGSSLSSSFPLLPTESLCMRVCHAEPFRVSDQGSLASAIFLVGGTWRLILLLPCLTATAHLEHSAPIAL